nr:hypothetical protein BaRGS_022917 [Batillaria attramentaria]
MLTMEELLESLIKKARLECEEAHRLLVAALNGLAALQLIRQQVSVRPGEAVELYREVLRSVEEHKDELRTDDLQQLHAMYNLQEILATKPQGVAPTLRDDLLSKQCGELRERYMAKARVYTNTSREQLLPLQQTLEDGSDWWLEVLATASERHLEEELVHKVREDLLENTRAALLKLVYQFRDIRGLQYVVQTHLVDLEAARRRLVADLKKLDKKGGLTQDIINKTVECCLRPAGAILKDWADIYCCEFCSSGAGAGGEAEDPMYLVHTRRQGTWADSELEKALKSLISFARSNRVDELDMATMRLRVKLPEEPAPEMPQPNILEATELDAHRLKLMSDRTVNRGELRKKLGQLMYLKNLAKSQENMKEGKNPDPCPVCQRELGREGSHSTKVSAVVQCLLNIKQVEPQAKALVFSTWTDVLDVIGKALQENDITYTALHTTGKFQRNLTAFRERDEMQVLLLPFHSGANGLNLIEATHVLLVEPILNAAQEAQAIGRVHRIGQTRPTKIHRFMVRRTIEERIHGLMETTLRPAAASTDTTASADDNAMTIGQLVSLFQDTLGSVRGDDGDEAGEEEEEAGEDDGWGFQHDQRYKQHGCCVWHASSQHRGSFN